MTEPQQPVQPAVIRDWAIREGMLDGIRVGRLPNSVREAYAAAHPGARVDPYAAAGRRSQTATA